VKERDIQRAILDYLAARGVLAFRMQTGAVQSEYKGKSRFMRFGVPGMADVLAFIQPENCDEDFSHQLAYWIECKAPTGKQSELQKSFQRQVEDHGHRYVVARSVEDVMEALK